MTAGSGFVPVVDDHLVNRLAAVPRPRARRASRGADMVSALRAVREHATA